MTHGIINQQMLTMSARYAHDHGGITQALFCCIACGADAEVKVLRRHQRGMSCTLCFLPLAHLLLLQ